MRRFKPQLENPHGGFLDIDALPRDLDQTLVWTVVHEEGDWLLIPGRWSINRMAYVICDIAWTEADQQRPAYRYG